MDFDEHGISIVSAGGKGTIDTLVQLYRAHGVRTYVVFDNDDGNSSEKAANRTLCRLLGITEADAPAARVDGEFTILAGNWEKQSRTDADVFQHGLYDELEQRGRTALGISSGKNKPLIARYVADGLSQAGCIPDTVGKLLDAVRAKLPESQDMADRREMLSVPGDIFA